MAPVRPKKRDSNSASTMKAVATPRHQSPIKQRKGIISAQQKQALIDNLQLEITERARRMRAQYNLQAQGLRSRIEIRINRIPMPLRKLKMEDLLLKYAEKEQRTAAASRHPPPVPFKDITSLRSPQKPAQQQSRPQRVGRVAKRQSNEISGDKENEIEDMANPKKRRVIHHNDGHPIRPAQILSPTSSNSRLNANRERPTSPAKSQIARPASPLKNAPPTRTATATKMLSNFVEKAKSARATGTRKVTTTSNSSTTTTGTTAASKTRRAPAPATSRAPTSRPATRMGRRLSVTSEMSEASTTTVIRRNAAPKSTNPAPRRKPVTAATNKGTASSDAKKAAPKTAAASTTRTGRVLRSRA
ncbi:unnamed protein product [Clonostachys rosea]|uniref:Borealin N-terminal domain-containing protein n=1 Tax=Bionectria ochroleuca TaxID=29856 RepID=A0ABY6UT75_BIOOC|nr:unnamed protein product [Clonostachys rosea]